MSNEIQNPKSKKILPFSYLALICHLDFVIWILLLLVSVGVLYENWTVWHNSVVGALALILYYAITTIAWGRVIERVLPLGRAWSRIFGFLISFYLSALAIGVPVVLWKYDRVTIAAYLFFAAVAGVLLARTHRPVLESTPAERELGWNLKFSNWLLALLAVLAVLFVFLVWHARTGVYILSPWDALSSFSLMLFFAVAFLVGLAVFSSRSIRLILVILVTFSFLAHLYLPMVYTTGFGGDKWRHLGAEKWLQEGNIYTPSVWGEASRSVIHFGPVAVPEALAAGNKTSYAAQWSMTIMLAESLGVDVFWTDLLLVFLLWSFFLPLILYQFGKLIFENKSMGLVLGFLPALFYTFQSEGAITIPVSFGHLFFFFVLLLWAYYVKRGLRSVLICASVLTLLSYWGYILNFFVLVGVGALAIVFRRRRRQPRDNLIFGLLALISVLAIPFLEVFQGLSSFLPGSISLTNAGNALADAFGRLVGLVGVIVPPDYIDQGNFLYNQSGGSLSRLPLFSYRLVPFLVSSLVWLGIAATIYFLFRHRRQGKTVVFLAVIFMISLGSYFVSWSFTQGVHILARRLNETIVFLMIILLGYGCCLLLKTEKIKILARKRILAVCFILAFAATSTYASGPKLQVVTADQLQAAEIVWSELKSQEPPYCVIASTWPLLGLEAVSARRVIAGGFPLYNEYAQPERVKIFEMLSKKPVLVWFEGAFRITGANTCYYMNEKRWLNDIMFKETVELLGEPQKVGVVYIWKVENRRTVVAESGSPLRLLTE